VIEIDEVFDDRMTCGRVNVVEPREKGALRALVLDDRSTMVVGVARASMLVLVASRASVASRSAPG